MSREEREALLGDLVLAIRRHQNAQEAFDDAAVAYLGINRSDGRALDILDQHGRLTAGQLARESGLSSGAVTTMLDRLERAGYVRRVRDDVDRRRILVELTDDARERAGQVWGPLGEQAMGWMARLDDGELQFIRDFLVRSRETLDDHLARVNALRRAREEEAG